jgi:hypothetical protein
MASTLPAPLNELSLTTELRIARFSPWSRLYWVEAVLSGAVSAAELSGRIVRQSVGDGLINAWVRCEDRKDPDHVRVKAVAMLAEGVDPADVRVELSAPGRLVAVIAPGEQLEWTSAGLIGLNPLDDGRALVEYWGEWSGDANDVVLQAGSRKVKAAPISTRAGRPATFRTVVDYPFDRPMLRVVSRRGGGQKFIHFAQYEADHAPTCDRLAAMQGRYAGQTAWLIGNGPSVRTEDLDRLAGKLSFAFNRFHLAYPRTAFRPTFTLTGDTQMIVDFGQDIVSQSAGEVFVAHPTRPDIPGEFCWIRSVYVFPALFSRDPTRWITPGGSSLYVAMQIAFYLGVRRFYLYGVDFTFDFTLDPGATDLNRAAFGDDNHFIADYRGGKPWTPPSLENILSSFMAARQLMEGEDGFIRNATHGGALGVLDRVDFEAALADS